MESGEKQVEKRIEKAKIAGGLFGTEKKEGTERRCSAKGRSKPDFHGRAMPGRGRLDDSSRFPSRTFVDAPFESRTFSDHATRKTTL